MRGDPGDDAANCPDKQSQLDGLTDDEANGDQRHDDDHADERAC